MKKIFFVLILAFVFLSITGCSKSDEAYKELIEKGVESIEQAEYGKEEVYFEQALEEKEQDETASDLLKQTILIQEVENEMKNGELEKAEIAVEALIKIEDGSELLVERATVIKDEIEKLQSEHEKFSDIYDKAKKLLEQEEYDQSIEMLEEVLEADMSHVFYDDIKNDLEKLLKEVEKAKEEAALAAQKAKEKRAKEEQRKKEEEKKKAEQQAAANKGIGDFSGYWLSSDIACHITSSYIACAMPYSDFITNDQISSIQHINNSEVNVTFTDGIVSTFTLSDNKSTLHTPGGTYTRVSKEDANAIFDGYYELP